MDEIALIVIVVISILIVAVAFVSVAINQAEHDQNGENVPISGNTTGNETLNDNNTTYPIVIVYYPDPKEVC